MNEVGDLQKRNAASGKSKRGPSRLFKVVDSAEAPPWSPHNVPQKKTASLGVKRSNGLGSVTKLKVEGHFPLRVDLI